MDFGDAGELLVGEEKILGPNAERGLVFQDLPRNRHEPARRRHRGRLNGKLSG